jgi:2-(1,2-epoxy-1,2-dihydrophenyl)acetyl-CoA isomerase
MRALLRESWDRSLPDQLNAEVEALVATARTKDAGGAVAAFTAKRRPVFQGD